MGKKQKYYVVWIGVEPGIYDSWEDCQLQIKGVSDAKYKAFKTLEEAQEAFGKLPEDFYGKQNKPRSLSKNIDSIVQDSLSVDAACSGNPGLMEYRGVHTLTGEEIFHQGPFKKGTNNIGEFLALVHGLAHCAKKKDPFKTIYSDSRTAIKWVRDKKANTKLAKSRSNEQLFVLIKRAEAWLKKNEFQNPILKWDTENWGEIPADFGRK